MLGLRNLPFWAGVVSSLSSWVSEGTSSLTEVRLVYDEVVVGSLCLSFLEALEEKASQGAGAWDFFSLTEMKQALEYAWGESGK